MKIINTIGLALFMLMLATVSSHAQVSAPVGVTEGKASQIVGWYVHEGVFFEQYVQLTNASNDSSVTVHIQVWGSELGTGDPVTDPCTEINITDTYTPNDTHTYDIANLVRNTDPCNADSAISCTTVWGLGGSQSIGFFTITPVVSDTDRRAIAFNNLFGEISYEGDTADSAGRVNAIGRLAVSAATGAPLNDGTILDGVNNLYTHLRPEVLSFNFEYPATDLLDDTGVEDANIAHIIFEDNYSGPFGDYRSQPGSATFNTLIFDDQEVPVSCQSFTPTCISMQGISDGLDRFDPGTSNPGIDGGDSAINSPVMCPGNSTEIGWVRLAVTGIDDFENVFGVAGFGESDVFTNFNHIYQMVGQGARVFPTPEPTPTPTATPTPTETATPTPTGGGGGGGSGCAIAGPVQAGTALANMLIVLLPGVAFALRRRFAK